MTAELCFPFAAVVSLMALPLAVNWWHAEMDHRRRYGRRASLRARARTLWAAMRLVRRAQAMALRFAARRAGSCLLALLGVGICMVVVGLLGLWLIWDGMRAAVWWHNRSER